MNYFQAILLGIVQGLTEFLPVSSSGHLVIAQHLVPGFSQPGVLFDVVLHAGTLLAVVAYFWRRLLKLNINYITWLVVGSIPAGLFGYFASDFVENLFTSITVVAIALLVTGVMNFLTDKAKQSKGKITPLKALVIGVFQAVAIVPGISRSGSTIFAGVKQGINRKEAAEFSFILSVPAVLGANLLQITKYTSFSFLKGETAYLAGFLAAFVTGLAAISLTMKLLTQKRFRIFAYYAFALGLFILASRQF